MKRFKLFTLKESSTTKVDTLPQTRRGSYFDVLKNQTGKVILLSIITSTFFLPFILFYFLKTLYFVNLPYIADPVAELYRTFLFTVFTNLIYMPLLLLGFIGLGATFVFAKDLLTQKPNIGVFNDLKVNIKLNIKESLGAGFIFWLGLFVFNINFAFYPTIQNMPYIVYPFAVIVTLGFVFTTILALFILASGTLYQNTGRSMLRNNYLFTLILFPKNVLFTIISLSPLIIFFFVPFVLIEMISFGVIVIIGMMHLALSFMAYALPQFDKFINNEYAHDIVGQGLNKKE